MYRNRKGYFSINVQIVGDARLRIRDIVARWPGSTHDATIFANSHIRARHENGEFPNTVLLGKKISILNMQNIVCFYSAWFF